MGVSSQFLQDLLAKLPEADRGSVEAVFSKAEAAEAVKFADTGAKRQSDYSRHLDALRTQQEELNAKTARVEDTYAQQTAWWEANKPLVEAGKKALGGDGNPNPNPATAPAKVELPPDVLRKDDVLKLINEREAGAVAFIAATNELTMRHYQEFGERLNVNELLADPNVAKVGLAGVYQQKYQDRYAAKAATAEEARINKLVEERVATERKQFASRMPYPVAANGADASPLDSLAATEKPDASQFTAEAAADEYLQLAAAKGR